MHPYGPFDPNPLGGPFAKPSPGDMVWETSKGIYSWQAPEALLYDYPRLWSCWHRLRMCPEPPTHEQIERWSAFEVDAHLTMLAARNRRKIADGAETGGKA